MLTLYDYYRSTASYRVRIALNYKRLPFHSKSVHLVNNGGEQHTPLYQSINPQQLVPTLQDGSFRVSQSMAILEYLEEKYPRPPLLPHDFEKRAKVRALANIIACDIHPLNNLRVLQYLKSHLQASEQQKIDWYHHWLHVNFSAIEQLLQQNKAGPYCFGKHITLADICLIPQVYNAIRFRCDMKNYPLIMKINQNCLQIPTFIEASPEMINQQNALEQNT